MHRIIVAGIDTNVGKTIVSAILTMLLNGDYWKPIQCGEEKNSDTSIMQNWLDTTKHFIHLPAYSFCKPVSPHHAACLEKISITADTITIPRTTRTIIIESVGGILVPLTKRKLSIDLFATWNCQWIIVSKHYLGSINHTLLTVEALKQRKIPILGLIFNGNLNPDSESVILEVSQLPVLGRLLPEPYLNQQIFQKYVEKWQPHFSKHLP